MRRSIYTIFAAVFLTPLHIVAADQPTACELLDKYAANRDKLTSFIAKTEARHSAQWGNQERPDLGRLTSELRFDGKRIHLLHYYWEHLAAIDVIAPIRDASYWADLWDGKHSITFGKRMSTDDRWAEISTEQRPVKHNTVVWCGGVALLGIRYSDYEPIDSVLRRAASMSVRPVREQVGSVACYVVDANTTSGKYTVWFDPQHGYQIARADIRAGPEHIFRRRPVKDNESNSLSVRNIRFEKIDGTWVPMESDIHGTSVRQRQDSTCTSTTHHKITQIILNPDHEALGSFVPVIEDGTNVRDRESSVTYTWQNGKLVDMTGQQYSLDDISNLPKLEGKVLPPLDGFDPKPQKGQLRNKRILVCFWDMDRCPSSVYYVLQLKEKQAVLADKNVFVLLIHVGGVKEDILQAWIKGREIPFVCGLIQGEANETLQRWCVRGLPWLVLTDSKQIVRAEGLRLRELEDEIEQASGATNSESSDERQATKNESSR